MNESLDVIVVGAGPVGLTAALACVRRGLKVRVVDAAWHSGASRAVTTLHPSSLGLAADLGVERPLQEAGHSVECWSLYVDRERSAALDLTELPSGRAGMVVPQESLRRILLEALKAQDVEVLWNHEVIGVAEHTDHVDVYAVHHEFAPRLLAGSPSWTDSPELAWRAKFVFGADGYSSLVRRALGIDLIDLQSTESWAMYETTLARGLGHEACIAFQNELVSAVWPMREDRARWLFQLSGDLDRPQNWDTFRRLYEQRLPWLEARALAVEWSSVMDFERLLASRFGSHRACLAGDAAHVTGPVGAQSLNAGLREAHDLARYVADVQHGIVTGDVFAHFDRERQLEWRRLLGIGLELHPQPRASPALGSHLARVLPCLPVSAEDLAPALSRLELRLG